MSIEARYLLVEGIKNDHLALGQHVNPKVDGISTFAYIRGLRDTAPEKNYGIVELLVCEGSLEGQTIWGPYDHRAQVGCMMAGEPNPQDRIALEACLDQYLAANPPEPRKAPEPLPTTAAYCREPYCANF